MIRKLHKRKDRKGAAIIETAFALPVLFILLFGLVEFGRAFWAIQALNAAARKGAYSGMMGGVSNAEVRAEIKDFLAASNIDVSDAQIFILDGSPYDQLGADDDPPSADELSPVDLLDEDVMVPRALAIVRIEVPFEDISILSPVWLGDATIVGQVAMRHE